MLLPPVQKEIKLKDSNSYIILDGNILKDHPEYKKLCFSYMLTIKKIKFKSLKTNLFFIHIVNRKDITKRLIPMSISSIIHNPSFLTNGYFTDITRHEKVFIQSPNSDVDVLVSMTSFLAKK